MLNNKFTLFNGKISVEFIPYGGTITSIMVPDRDGKMTEILLGLNSLEEYMVQDKFLCALIGRYANRIGNARFSLNGKEYKLNTNNGENSLHGGPTGFNTKNWVIESYDETSAVLSLVSPDMDEGFPGELKTTVKYYLKDCSLCIDYEAVSDDDTICNLTSHLYFNLSGDTKKSVLDHQISIDADFYTPTNAGSIPTGEIASVAGTPLDLRNMTRVGDHIDDSFDQMLMAAGYDHNFVIRGEVGTLRHAAKVYSDENGIQLDFLTDQPGMQFYSGNYLDGNQRRTGFCLESQAYPDSPNKPNFPSCILKRGSKYTHKAVYKFSVK